MENKGPPKRLPSCIWERKNSENSPSSMNLINRNMPSIPNDPRLQNAPDPTRVTRSDNRSERQDTGDPSGSRALRYDSNFLTFLQRMSDTPGLARTMTELLRTFQGTVCRRWRGWPGSAGSGSAAGSPGRGRRRNSRCSA